MKEMDCVEVINEKDRYVKDGVHKGCRDGSVIRTLLMGLGWLTFRNTVKR